MKISDDVCEVLKSLEWEGDDKNIAKITAGQLDRKLYLKVNDVIESLGGKWNRKSKGHVFDLLSRKDQLDVVIETGEILTIKEIQKLFQLFETPEKLANKMCEIANLSSTFRVLEPSAGNGKIVQEILKFSTNVQAVEIQAECCDKLRELNIGVTNRDFLTVEPIDEFDAVIMNPPFSAQQDVDHVLHAYKFLKPGGTLVAIMSPGWRFRSNKKSVQFREFLENIGGEIIEVEEGTFKESGTMIKTVMVVLKKI